MKENGSPNDKLILVADDDADILNLVRFRLEQWGYGTVVAGNGEEALALVREQLPDACVLDVLVPFNPRDLHDRVTALLART